MSLAVIICQFCIKIANERKFFFFIKHCAKLKNIFRKISVIFRNEFDFFFSYDPKTQILAAVLSSLAYLSQVMIQSDKKLKTVAKETGVNRHRSGQF